MEYLDLLKLRLDVLQEDFQNAPTSDTRREILFAIVDLNRKISDILEREVETELTE